MLGSLQRSRIPSVRSITGDAILTFGEDGCIEAANPVAEGLLLYAPNELLGRRIFSLVSRECEAEFDAILDNQSAELDATELGRPRAFRLIRKDGHSVAVQATITPVRFDKRLFWILLAQDNTSHDRAATQWERMERLAAIGQAASGIAHESRNSLQRIAAAVHHLKKGTSDTQKVAECIARIESGMSDLQCLHETVLEFVKPRVLQPAFTDIRDVVHSAWKAATGRPGDTDSELHENHTEADTHCEVDSFAIRQVFRNIFENSLAACPSKCCVDVSYEEVEPSGESGLQLMIHDNGPGLSDQQRRMIFDAFYTTKEHGLGLGMTIAKQIVEAHGGEISVGDGPGAEVVIMFRKVLA
jgi:PAS domain S-box-containing protein